MKRTGYYFVECLGAGGSGSADYDTGDGSGGGGGGYIGGIVSLVSKLQMILVISLVLSALFD